MTRPTTDEAVVNILGGLSADAGCLVTASARQAGGIRPAVPAADLARAAPATNRGVFILSPPPISPRRSADTFFRLDF